MGEETRVVDIHPIRYQQRNTEAISKWSNLIMSLFSALENLSPEVISETDLSLHFKGFQSESEGAGVPFV